MGESLKIIWPASVHGRDMQKGMAVRILRAPFVTALLPKCRTSCIRGGELGHQQCAGKSTVCSCLPVCTSTYALAKLPLQADTAICPQIKRCQIRKRRDNHIQAHFRGSQPREGVVGGGEPFPAHTPQTPARRSRLKDGL
eukprot:scaffold306876_cov20-Tisochrysis_lutea.AAC.1